MLRPTVQANLFCGFHKLALRGLHQKSDLLAKSVENEGVFRGFLGLMINCKSTKLWEYFESFIKSAKYASPLAQNDIVYSIGNVIRDAILNRAKIAKYFSILADEMNDVTSKEQFILVICFYDDHQTDDCLFLFFAFRCCK